MGSTITFGNTGKPNVNEDDENSKKIFEEIQIYNMNVNQQVKIFSEFFIHNVNEKFRKNISHFHETYKLKKNYLPREDSIYKIYVVENKFTRTLYNLKVYKINITELPEDYSDLSSDLEKNMLINDVGVMQNLKHPNAENLVHAYANSKKTYFLFMFVVTFTSRISLLTKMNEKIAKCRKFTEFEFQQIFKFFLEILITMKNVNLIHRGLCPSAIVFQKDDDYSTLTIKNFFFSSINNTGIARGLTGTLWYSAPEVLRDSDQDYKVDTYSAGLILFQMLTLENPYQNIETKEDIMKKIESKMILEIFPIYSKLGNYGKYLEKISRMIQENKTIRSSIDEIISNRDIKQIRSDIVKYYMEDKSNMFFNLKINLNILLKFKAKLEKMNKTLLGLIFNIFQRCRFLIMDQKQIMVINNLFDFFDLNSNNFVTTDEFRDKIYEYHLENSKKNKLTKLDIDNKDENQSIANYDQFVQEDIKKYADIYKECVEKLLDNDFCKSNGIETSQFNFKVFCVITLFLNFFDEKERNLLKREKQQLDLTENNCVSRRNTVTPFPNIKKSFVVDKNQSNIQNENLNNSHNKNSSSKNNDNTNKSIKDEKFKYGYDFDIEKPECYCDTNENKLYAVFNCYFNTKNFMAFERIFDKKIDYKTITTMEHLLRDLYKDIFILNTIENEMKYIAKDNFIKLLELEYTGKPLNIKSSK